MLIPKCFKHCTVCGEVFKQVWEDDDHCLSCRSGGYIDPETERILARIPRYF